MVFNLLIVLEAEMFTYVPWLKNAGQNTGYMYKHKLYWFHLFIITIFNGAKLNSYINENKYSYELR